MLGDGIEMPKPGVAVEIKPGIDLIELGWIKIRYPEGFSEVKVTSGSLKEKAAAAMERMWEITKPGFDEQKSRKAADPTWHPAHEPWQGVEFPVERAALPSSCGAIAATMALILANSGVEGVSLLRCKVAGVGEKYAGHIVVMFAPEVARGVGEEFHHGALLQPDYKGNPAWSPMAAGEYDEFCSRDSRPTYQQGKDGFLVRVKPE